MWLMPGSRYRKKRAAAPLDPGALSLHAFARAQAAIRFTEDFNLELDAECRATGHLDLTIGDVGDVDFELHAECRATGDLDLEVVPPTETVALFYGFDHQIGPNSINNTDFMSFQGNGSVPAQPPRKAPGRSMRIDADTTLNERRLSFDASIPASGEFTFGFAAALATVVRNGTGTGEYRFAGMQQGTSTPEWTIRFDVGSGVFRIYEGSTLRASSAAQSNVIGVWNFYEVHFDKSATGFIRLLRNGSEIATYSGATDQTYNRVMLQNGWNSSSDRVAHDFDDYYHRVGGPIGDVQCLPLLLDSVVRGDYTRSNGALDRISHVQIKPFTSEVATEYVSINAGTALIDEYTFEGLPQAMPIHAFAVMGSGFTNFAPAATGRFRVDDGNDLQESGTISWPTLQFNAAWFHPTNPWTGVPWVAEDLVGLTISHRRSDANSTEKRVMSFGAAVLVPFDPPPPPEQIDLALHATCAAKGETFLTVLGSEGEMEFWPGSHNFLVPEYTTLTIRAWGGGGSGSATTSAGGAAGVNDGIVNGNAGGASTVAELSLSAGGGGAGTGAQNPSGSVNVGTGGAGGTASGGDTNTNGSAGTSGSFAWNSGSNFVKAGDGGASGNGGAARTGPTDAFGDPSVGVNGLAGNPIGGGGTGGCNHVPHSGNASYFCRGGGGGSYVEKVYTFGVTAGAPDPFESLALVVGAGGAPVSAWGGVGASTSGAGGPGKIEIEWS